VSGKRSFGANILISFGFTGLFTVFAFANSVVVARMVGAEGRGLYALLVAVLSLAGPIGTLGLNYASTWAVGQKWPTAQVAMLNHLWSGIVLLLGALVSGAVLLGFGGLPDADWALVVLAAGVTLPAAVYAENTRGVLLGLKQVVRYHTVQAAYGAVLLTANIALLGWGPRAVLLTLAISYWVPAAALLLGHIPHLRRAEMPTRELAESSVTYGVKTSATNLGEAALQRLDYLLVTPIVGVGAVGLYSTAVQISAILAWGGLIAGRMMLTQSANDPEGVESRRKLGLAVRTLLLAVALAAVGAAATTWFLIPLVFGEEFAPAYHGLLILLPSSLSMGAYALISTYLIGRNVIRPVLRAGLVSVALVVVCSPLAALAFGWLGVAAVRTAALALQLLLTVRAYRAETGESFRWVFDGADFNALRNWVQARRNRGAG
jgi:O-antigen/teichoic acid export membrane protein